MFDKYRNQPNYRPCSIISAPSPLFWQSTPIFNQAFMDKANKLPGMLLNYFLKHPGCFLGLLQYTKLLDILYLSYLFKKEVYTFFWKYFLQHQWPLYLPWYDKNELRDQTGYWFIWASGLLPLFQNFTTPSNMIYGRMIT